LRERAVELDRADLRLQRVVVLEVGTEARRAAAGGLLQRPEVDDEGIARHQKRLLAHVMKRLLDRILFGLALRDLVLVAAADDDEVDENALIGLDVERSLVVDVGDTTEREVVRGGGVVDRTVVDDLRAVEERRARGGV